MSGNTLPSPETAAASGRQIQLWRWEPHQLKWGWPPILVPLHQTCLVGPWEGIVRSLTDYICHHTARPAWVILKHVWSAFIIILSNLHELECLYDISSWKQWHTTCSCYYHNTRLSHFVQHIIIMHCSIGGTGGPPEIYKDGTAFKYSIMKFTLQELHHPTQQLHDDGCKTSEPHCQNNYLHWQSVSTSSVKLINYSKCCKTT